MKYPPTPNMIRGQMLAALVLLPLAVRAANVTWDGATSANDTGTWETGTNWSTSAIPTTADNAQLLDVTSGTREVTISSGSPQTINKLTVTQTTVGAFNVLNVNDNLTISGNATPFAITATAGQDSIVTNIAAGKTLLATSTGTITSTLGGALNLAAGSIFKTEGSSVSVALAGATTMATGAELRIKFTTDTANGQLTNTGALLMDGASATIDIATTTDNFAAFGRRFTNTGTWTLDNASTFTYTSSTGRNVSNTTGSNNDNSGTLSVKNGSTLAFKTLFNAGTVNAGSSTAGVSNATVTLGSNVFVHDTDFSNGLTSTSAGTANTSTATLNINGDAFFGNTTGGNTTRTISLYNGTNLAGTITSTGATINVGDGTTPTIFTMAHDGARVVNAAGNTFNVKSGASLLMKGYSTAGTSYGFTTIANAGTFTQAGSVKLQGSTTGTRSITTTSGGTYRIQGTGAVIEALKSTTNSSSVKATSFAVTGGVLQGNTAADRLTFTNTTGNSATTHTSMTVSLTNAELAAGNGSNGSGTSSIGSLEFVNTNITFGGTSKLSVDIGGTSGSGLFDSIALTGTGATFTLSGTNDTLDLRLVNSFSASASAAYTIVTGTSIVGSFETLLLNGSSLTAGEYSVNYTATGVEVVFAASAIPEPSTIALLAGGMVLAVCVYRRRRVAV